MIFKSIPFWVILILSVLLIVSNMAWVIVYQSQREINQSLRAKVKQLNDGLNNVSQSLQKYEKENAGKIKIVKEVKVLERKNKELIELKERRKLWNELNEF